MRFRPSLFVLLLAACTSEPRPDAAVPADTAVAPLPAPDTALSPLASWRARVAAELFVRPGACPFECCRYGDWTAESTIPLRAAKRLEAQVLSTLAPEEHFRADSGTVHVTGLMLVAVRDTLSAYLGENPRRLAAGDTLVLLEPLGEGYFNVWHRGEVLASEPFWDPPNDTLRADRIGEYAREWWVHATAADGRSGWFLADSVELRGADACAGPEPL